MTEKPRRKIRTIDRARAVARSKARTAARIARSEKPATNPCGHPAEAVVSSREGTHFCGQCKTEARLRGPLTPTWVRDLAEAIAADVIHHSEGELDQGVLTAAIENRIADRLIKVYPKEAAEDKKGGEPPW